MPRSAIPTAMAGCCRKSPRDCPAASTAAAPRSPRRPISPPRSAGRPPPMANTGSVTAPERPRDDLAGKLVRRVIQRAPSSISGREIVQVETEIPVGVESGWHVHPGEEVGYIVAGNVEMKVQGRPTVILHAGDGFLI